MPSKMPAPCRRRSRFGRNVVALRKQAGITQAQAAEKVGLSTRYWQSIEAGEFFPPIARLAKIKAVFGSSWESLFEGCE